MNKIDVNKILNIGFCLLLFNSLIIAQSFSVELENNSLSGPLGTEIIFNFHITNESNSELTLYFSRIKNDLPPEWSSSLCFDACFAPFLDSVVTNSNYNSSPILVGETREFSVHVFPLINDGQANITIQIGDEGNTSNTLQYDLIANSIITNIESDNTQLKSYVLNQNYPNPFNPNTMINFSLPKSGQVKLMVIDVIGRTVDILIDGDYPSGDHTIEFISNDLASGIYFYSLETKDQILIKKMVLEK